MKRNSFPTNNRIPDVINQSITKEFTQVPNNLLRNPEISFKAKGILCLLLSNKEGWYSYLTTIKQMAKEGDEALRNGIAELEKAGYLMRIQFRDKKTKIRRGSFWAYTDIPNNFDMADSVKMLEKQGMELFVYQKNQQENLNQGNPDMDSQDIGNQSLKILNIKTLKDNNTNADMYASASKNGYLSKSMFEKFWRIYPRKVNKGQAKTAFEKICNKPTKERPTWKQVAKAIIQQSKSERWQDEKYIPHPTTWLNQQRWLDNACNYTTPKFDKDDANQKDYTHEELEELRNGPDGYKWVGIDLD